LARGEPTRLQVVVARRQADRPLPPRLLTHHAPHGVGVRLAGLDPAPGQGPAALAGWAAAPDQQKAARVVQDDRADTIYAHLTKITTRQRAAALTGWCRTKHRG